MFERRAVKQLPQKACESCKIAKPLHQFDPNANICRSCSPRTQDRWAKVPWNADATFLR
jgi:hypothetical protein